LAVFNNESLFGLIGLSAVLAAVPLLVVTMTAFVKISIVLFILRNALGLQQTPPNIVLNTVALMLAFFISAPVLANAYDAAKAAAPSMSRLSDLEAALAASLEPFQAFLAKHADPRQTEFFVSATTKVWGDTMPAPRPDALIALVPGFMLTELTRAFVAGFVIYLPFLVIDLVVTAVLMAMGMQQVSPNVISVPFKLLLFVMVDGWSRLFHGLVLSYA
jgi:type III secretion protein R